MLSVGEYEHRLLLNRVYLTLRHERYKALSLDLTRHNPWLHDLTISSERMSVWIHVFGLIGKYNSILISLDDGLTLAIYRAGKRQ